MINLKKNIQPQHSPAETFVVSGEMIDGFGEDKYLLLCGKNGKGSVTCGVFDGCGGLGARHYPSANGHTGAYIAATLARDTLEATITSGNFNGYGEALKKAFRQKKAELEAADGEGIGKSDMVATLPTTAVCGIIDEKNISLQFIGDSRAYSLDGFGLHLLSSDCKKNPSDQLFGEQRLQDYINADRDFRLISRKIKGASTKIYIMCTDGFYSAFRTPMEMECVLLETLSESSDSNEWQEKLNKIMLELAADDYTAVFICYGYKSFGNMKNKLSVRREQLKKDCEKLFSLQGTEYVASAEELWKSYKISFSQKH